MSLENEWLECGIIMQNTKRSWLLQSGGTHFWACMYLLLKTQQKHDSCHETLGNHAEELWVIFGQDGSIQTAYDNKISSLQFLKLSFEGLCNSTISWT